MCVAVVSASHVKDVVKNMTYLAGEEMAADLHKDLVVLVGGLVPWNDDLSAGQVLQLIHLEKTQRS